MRKLMIAFLALAAMAVTSGWVLADGTVPATPKKHHPHHKGKKKPAPSTSAPVSTAPTK